MGECGGMFKKGFIGLMIVWAMIFLVDVQAQEGELSYKHQSRRDPFMPLISPTGYLINMESKEDADLHLEGILYDESGDSIAIINGELLKVGENIGDAVLSKIGQNKIIVLKDNEKIEIELRGEEQ